jgi:hypothetical protein
LIAHCGLRSPRVAQQSLAGEIFLSGPVGGEESPGLPGLEGVSPDDLGQTRLLALFEGTKTQGHRQRQLSRVESYCQLR